MTETENVATYARIRPYNPALDEDKRVSARAVDGSRVINKNGDHEDIYNFTGVFDMKDETTDVFERAMKPLLDHKTLQGINSIFIIYGQSGSGKSFTLLGERDHLGLLPMSLNYLLNKTEIVKNIYLSSIEAYGIKPTKIGLYDLISQLSKKENFKNFKNVKNGKIKTKKYNKHDSFVFDPYTSAVSQSSVTALTAQSIKITANNCLSIVTELQSVSHIAPTLKNTVSSRGHTVFFCRIEMAEMEDVHFIAVDLAGSEGQTALGTQDEFVRGLSNALAVNVEDSDAIFKEMYKLRSLEAGCINNGLTQVQCIFNELIKHKFSKAKGLGLRKVLSSFISLKSAYSIMFTISASKDNNTVTKATLNFAKQTQLVQVRTQKARKKIDKDALIQELKVLIERLKCKVTQKDLRIKGLQAQIAGTDIPLLKNKPKTADLFGAMDNLQKQIAEAEEEDEKWTIETNDLQMPQNGSSVNERELKHIFYEMDTDGNGTIDCAELHSALQNKMGKSMSADETKKLFAEYDCDGNGQIGYNEFRTMIGKKWFVDTFKRKLSTQLERVVSQRYLNLCDIDEKEDTKLSDSGSESESESDLSLSQLSDAFDRKGYEQRIDDLQKELTEFKRQNKELENKIRNISRKDTIWAGDYFTTWLQKKSRYIGTWRQRYAVLKDGAIKTFHTKRMQYCTETIVIGDIRRIEHENVEFKTTEFHIVCKNITFQFKANSVMDKRNWLKILKTIHAIE